MKTTTKLAISNLKVNKAKSILIGIAIFLTTTLLASIGLTGMTLINAQLKNASAQFGSQYATYSRVTEQQVQEIKKHGQFHSVGVSTVASLLTQENITLVSRYVDQNTMTLLNTALSEGVMPEQVDEIAGSKEVFEAFGLEQPKLGDRITLPYRPNGEGVIQEREFIISGFFPSLTANEDNEEVTYQVYIAKAFFEEIVPQQNEREYTVCFQMYNNDNLNVDQMIHKIEAAGEELGISKNNMTMNTIFLMYEFDPGSETIISCIIIMGLVIFISVIVIYNIFHVGLIQKIQEYGKLKALGATKKQLKSLLLKEGSILAGLAIPFGLIAGLVVTYCIYNFIFLNNADSMGMERVTIFYPDILGGVAILSYLTVLLSLGRPMKVVSNISAVEAMKYQEALKGGKGTRKGAQRMNLFRLTMSNLSGNRKRTVTTILTMGLSCILFVIISNVAGNMDAEYEARTQLEYGQFRIELDADYNDTAYPENNFYNRQKQEPFRQEVLDQLQSIEGVTEVRTRKLVELYEESGDMEDRERYGLVSVVSEEEFDWLVKNAYRGEVDYQNTVEQDGIIYMFDTFLEDYGYQIGSSFQAKLFDGDEEIPFEAKILGTCGYSNDATYTITDQTFEKLGIKGDMNSIVFVDCKKGSEERVAAEIKRILDDMEASDYLQVTSYQKTLADSSNGIKITKSLSYTILVVVGLIGFMNMANTIITSIITRKRELGILQALGMTDRELNQMLQLEGGIFTAGTLLICLSLGNILGYLSFQFCKGRGIMGLNEYHLPLPELGILVLIIIALQVLLSFYLSRSLRKISIVERISYQG